MKREMIAAYIAMGVLQQLDKNDSEDGDYLNNRGWSQYELVSQALTTMLPIFDYLLADNIGEHIEYEGTYHYDVVEPLGMFFIAEMVRVEHVPTVDVLIRTARKYAE